MKFQPYLKPIVLVLVLMTLAPVVFPPGLRAQERTCEQALDRCLLVAAFLSNPIYYAFCYEGYVFCKKYIEG